MANATDTKPGNAKPAQQAAQPKPGNAQTAKPQTKPAAQPPVDTTEKLPDGVQAIEPGADNADELLAQIGAGTQAPDDGITVAGTAKYDKGGNIIPNKTPEDQIPEGDKDANKPVDTRTSEVPQAPKTSREGMKQCQGGHDMWPDTDENFPPQAPYLGRYSAEYIKRKLNPVKGEEVPKAPRKADPDRIIKR